MWIESESVGHASLSHRDEGHSVDEAQSPLPPLGRPTLDYDSRYGATIGRWTTEMFVEAVFRSLTKR